MRGSPIKHYAGRIQALPPRLYMPRSTYNMTHVMVSMLLPGLQKFAFGFSR